MTTSTTTAPKPRRFNWRLYGVLLAHFSADIILHVIAPLVLVS